jgi:hypothetical protein
MRKIETLGTILDGNIKIHYRDLFLQNLKLLTNGRIKLTVEKLYRKRSNEQNAYYWGVIVQSYMNGYLECYCEEITSDNAHHELKRECNYKEVLHESTGELKKVVKITTDLTTVESEEYYERCRNFIYEYFNIIVPLPNEQSEIKFN